MADYTGHLNLKKPSNDDAFNVADFNSNADKIDNALRATSRSLTEHNSDSGAHSQLFAGYYSRLEVDELLENFSGGFSPQILVNVTNGSSIICTNGAKTFTAISSGGVAIFELPSYGEWKILATRGQLSEEVTVSVTEVKRYEITITYFSAKLIVNAFSGAIVTAECEGRTYIATSIGEMAELIIPFAGTYTISASLMGRPSDVKTVDISLNGGEYEVDLSFFEATITIVSKPNCIARIQYDDQVSERELDDGGVCTFSAYKKGVYTITTVDGEYESSTITLDVVTLNGVYIANCEFYSAYITIYANVGSSITVTDSDGEVFAGCVAETDATEFLVRSIKNFDVSVVDGENVYAQAITMNSEKSRYYAFCQEADRTFQNNSWEVISKVSQAGRASEFWNIGDSYLTKYTDNKPLLLRIWGFDHDDLADGNGKAGITLGIHYIHNTLAPLVTNEEYDTVGYMDWTGAKFLNSAYFSLLPTALRPYVKTVRKQVHRTSTAFEFGDCRVFPVSEKELTGENVFSIDENGSSGYDYLAGHPENCVFKQSANVQYSYIALTRSLDKYGANRVIQCYDGVITSNTNGGSGNFAIAPAICV